jgi:phage antirepressor YoqD-like protein/predicted DNA-binding transcriptional regulator AlpA
MNELTQGKAMTLKEVSEITGAAYSTIAAYAQKAGWTENGRQTLLNEQQVTIILEAMKATNGQGQSQTFQDNLEGVETNQRMNELTVQGDKRMTVKEVAVVLGVSRQTIYRAMEDAGISDLSKNGQVTYLDEAQVTAIKTNLRKNSEVAKQAITDMEAAEMLLKSAEHFKARFEQEHNARIEAEQRLAIAEPKAAFFDQVADSKDAIQMRDVAAILNIPDWGRNKIFALLRQMKILDDRNIPYRSYQDKGYFRVIEQEYTDAEGETHINLKTLVYQPGVEFVRKIILRQQKGAA